MRIKNCSAAIQSGSSVPEMLCERDLAWELHSVSFMIKRLLALVPFPPRWGIGGEEGEIPGCSVGQKGRAEIGLKKQLRVSALLLLRSVPSLSWIQNSCSSQVWDRVGASYPQASLNWQSSGTALELLCVKC